jgi:glycine hydroxymethyltransferase
VTTRGFSTADCTLLAGLICDVLDHMGDESVVQQAREQALALCRTYPVYGK